MSLYTVGLFLASAAVASPLLGHQLPLGYQAEGDSQWTVFEHPIRSVAVIGAGPSGLQVAAALNEHNFSVRLFERQDSPGGNWYYQESAPIREPYPCAFKTSGCDVELRGLLNLDRSDRPLPVAAYTPETPGNLTRTFYEGEDGLTLNERWTEHTGTSPVWDSLHTNSPAVITELLDAPYPKDAPWVISTHLIQRHVRAFSSLHNLNSNDKPAYAHSSPITSYATRVELVKKKGDKWILSLRKLQRTSPDKIQASWWTEEFDAVVVATGSYDSTHVPDIKGLKEWSDAVREDGSHPVWHSQAYRKPNALKGKNVLIVGASVSASEISRDVAPSAAAVYISVRNNTNRAAHFLNRSIRRIAKEAVRLADIAEFEPLPPGAVGIEGGRIRLVNGTVLLGIDDVILATGFRRSNPFLRDYLASGDAVDSASRRAPIVSPKGLTSLHWTGHYSLVPFRCRSRHPSSADRDPPAVPDPTLAVTNWTVGRYQSLGFARVWAGLARIPNQARLWDEYRGAEENQALPAFFGSLRSEGIFRQFVQWLNNEAFIHGGRLVDNWPVENREVFVYYAAKEWAEDYITAENFTEAENVPYAGVGHHRKADAEDAFWRHAASEDLDW